MRIASLFLLFLACANKPLESSTVLLAPAPVLDPTTAPTTIAAALPVPAATNTIVILEGADANELASIFCYDAKAQLFVSSLQCLFLIPPGSKISDRAGKLRSASTVSPSADEVEAASPEPVAGEMFLHVKKERGTPHTKYGECFYWPESEAGLCELLPAKDDPGAKQLTVTEREALVAALLLQKSAATKDLVLRQAVYKDLNGDGVEDRFYSLTAGKLAGDKHNSYPHYQFSGAFFVDGAKPEQLVLVARGDFSRFSLKQAVDLNKDGRPELWLQILKSGDFSGYPPGVAKSGDFFGYPTEKGFELLTADKPKQADIIFSAK